MSLKKYPDSSSGHSASLPVEILDFSIFFFLIKSIVASVPLHTDFHKIFWKGILVLFPLTSKGFAARSSCALSWVATRGFRDMGDSSLSSGCRLLVCV